MSYPLPGDFDPSQLSQARGAFWGMRGASSRQVPGNPGASSDWWPNLLSDNSAEGRWPASAVGPGQW